MSRDYLDLRNLAKELDELREREEDPDGDWPLDEDEKARLADLKGLEKEIGDLHVESRNDPTLIPESEWKDYCRETAEDTGMIDRDSHMFAYVDWERFADDMRADCTTIEFDGTTYYHRA